MKNSICTAIVTYNRLELLKGALQSIKRQTEPTDILIVNNGSTDGTTEYLSTLEGIMVINQENVGGAGGFFTALKYIAENGYSYAWIMDDDIVAKPDTLAELVAAYRDLSEHTDVGFLCSNVLNPQGETVNVPTISRTLNGIGYEEWNKYLDKGYLKVDIATFVSVFLSTEVIKEVGLPIKELFIWGDDTEYTTRISRRYPSYLIGKSKIQHMRPGGVLSLRTISDPARVKMFELNVRNNFYYELKYGSALSRVRSLKKFLKDGFYFLRTGQFVKANVIFKGLFKALRFKAPVQFPDSVIPPRKDK